MNFRDEGYFVERATVYMNDVLSGKITACKWVRLACERQHKDLKKQNSFGFGYSFSHKRAEKACQFIELLPHVKGEKASKHETFDLEPWQCFFICVIFGWVDAEGFRRFQRVYIEVPRKNGKSPIASGIALYALMADGEKGAEVYTAASQREQARICFEDAKVMIENSPILKARFGVETNSLSIHMKSANSKMRALAKDQKGSLDGLNIHCAIVDELHAHKDRSTYDVLVSGTAARRQPIIFAITTAGFNRTSVCYEQHSYIKKILDNVIIDETYFGIIYTIDDTDDWKDPSSWMKANPNFGVSVYEKSIASECVKAINSSVQQSSFLTKHLNIWVNADNAWMNADLWDKCAEPSLRIEDFKGDKCYVACDLASKNDFCAKVITFVKDIEGKRHYYSFAQHYLNDLAIQNTPLEQVKSWGRDGLIKVNTGNTTDQDTIKEDIKNDYKTYAPLKVGFDRYQATMIIQELQKEGVKRLGEYNQSVLMMSEPMKEFEAAVMDGRFHFNGDPVFTWHVLNVVAHIDGKENVYPNRDKNARHQKIDSAIATIMSIGMSMQEAPRERKYQMVVL